MIETTLEPRAIESSANISLIDSETLNLLILLNDRLCEAAGAVRLARSRHFKAGSKEILLASLMQVADSIIRVFDKGCLPAPDEYDFARTMAANDVFLEDPKDFWEGKGND
jgi:predicted double-glycine peptidase